MNKAETLTNRNNQHLPNAKDYHLYFIVAGASAIAVLAAADGFGGDKFKKFAMRNIDYMLGENRQHFSYVIGFGNSFPKRPHHRGAYVCLNKLKHKD